MTASSSPKIVNVASGVAILMGLYLLVTSAFFPLGFLSPYDAKRLLQLILFAALMIFAVLWTPLRHMTIAQLVRLSSLQRAILSVFFLIGIASSLRLSHPGYALIDVSMIFVMLMLIAVTAASRELAGLQFDRWAIVLLAAMGFAVAIEEFMGHLVGWVLDIEFDFNLALMHFGHPRFYNQLQTWSIPMLAAFPLFFSGKRWIKPTCVILLGLQWFLVLAVGARGTFISLFVAMVFVGLWLPGQRRFWLRYQLAGLLAGILIYSSILFLNSILIPQTQSGNLYANSVGRPMVNTSGRTTFWRFSVKDVIENPLLGSGPTQYACDNARRLPAHPHSFLFRILGEWGLPAFLLVLILAFSIGLGFLKSLKHSKIRSQSDPPLKSMLATSLIAGVIHACVSGLLIMPASQVAMILIAGWTLSLCGNSQVQPKKLAVANFLLVTVLLSAVVTLAFAAREIPQLEERTSYYANNGRMAPRFWQHGRVCEYSYIQPETID